MKGRPEETLVLVEKKTIYLPGSPFMKGAIELQLGRDDASGTGVYGRGPLHKLKPPVPLMEATMVLSRGCGGLLGAHISRRTGEFFL